MSQSCENIKTFFFYFSQVDVFKVEAVSLDEITKVVIGHDGKGPGAGWYLEKVVIKEIINNEINNEYYFPCKR